MPYFTKQILLRPARCLTYYLEKTLQLGEQFRLYFIWNFIPTALESCYSKSQPPVGGLSSYMLEAGKPILHVLL